MANFNLEDYAPVQDRIVEFVRDFPNGCIRTRLVKQDGPEVVFEARIYKNTDDVVKGAYTSGWAREIEGKNPVNRTSHLENCETSAVGRALANMGYTTDAHRASRSEMLKAQQTRQDHEALLDFIRSVGATVEEAAEFQPGGSERRNIKGYIRENWQAMKEQPRLARLIVDALETATQHRFTS